MADEFLVQPPVPALAPFVQHYWLSLHNTDRTHLALPDGCIDIVIEVAGGRWRAWGYGSTTRPTLLPCEPGRHYLGIRFRPGMARHFIRSRADELTDRQEDAQALLALPLEPIAECVGEAGLFDAIDRRLASRLTAAAPALTCADRTVRAIQAAHGAVRLEAVATQLGLSPRQLQRQFLQTVGVTAKFFCRIARAERAAALMSREGRDPLADIAADAGYADQSHMTRDFERLRGASPAGRRVAFVQDPAEHAAGHWAPLR
jgi:AraC-like DNA-binding protein